ncbi:MAG: hypothetical protein WBA42_17000 [Mesorhizobium sp.]
MSEHAIEFLQEWICEKVQAPAHPALVEKHAETLARECAAKAAEAGIPLEDIQEEVGDIQELIAAKLEDAAEAEQAAGAGENPDSGRNADNENRSSK